MSESIVLVKDVMIKEVLTAVVDATVKEVSELMADRNVGAVVITSQDGSPAGIFSERDLLKRVISKGLSVDEPVEKVMTPKFICAYEQDHLEDVAELMVQGNFRHLPVISGESGRKGFRVFMHQAVSSEKLVGILSVREVIKQLLPEGMLDEQE